MSSSSPIHPRQALVFVLLLPAAALLLANLGSGSLFNHDDAIYAELLRQMHHHPGPIFELLGWRPPLYYTLLYLSTSLFGVNELGLRLVAALSGLLVLAVTYRAGVVLLRDHRVGFLAALALLSTFFFYLFARRVRGLDITLMLCIELSVVYGLVGFDRRRHWLTAGLFAGLAVLTKSAVGLAPIGILGAAVLVRRRWDLLRAWQVYAGLGVALAVAGIWPLLARVYMGASTMSDHVAFHLVQRATNNILKPQDGPLYYFGVLQEFEGPLGMALLLAVPLALVLAARARAGNAAALGIWAGAVFAAFSLAATRLEHYILPAYPAACLLLGWVICRAADALGQQAGRHARAVKLGVLGLSCLGLIWSWSSHNLRLLADLDHSPQEKELALQIKRTLPAPGKLYLLNMYWPVFDFYSGHAAVSLTTSPNAYALFCKVPTMCQSGKARLIKGEIPAELLASGPVAVAVDTRVTPPDVIRNLARQLTWQARTKHLVLYSRLPTKSPR